MSTVTTFESLQTESLVTVNYSLISENFKIIDSFIKGFPAFQRKIADLQKMQKATAADLSNFKLSTQNTFSTLNATLESRSGAGKVGSSLADNEEIKNIRKQFKEIKSFITENAREQHEAQQVRDKEVANIKEGFEKQIAQLKKELEQKQMRICNLEEESHTFRIKYVSKAELQVNSVKIQEQITQLQKSADQLKSVQELLQNLDVNNMKESIDMFQAKVNDQAEEVKRKLKYKADYTDIFKLEEMLLNIINYSYENCHRKFAEKNQTKKALIFLEKKLNRLFQTMFGEDEDKQGLVTTKTKCISCTKDLGDMEGKLDKYKAWSVFPVKDPQVKDRYSGFGAGFQTIVETTVGKKGIEATYDEKGKMVTPYNLSREVQGTLLRSGSKSNIRDTSMTKYQSIGKNSPSKGETNHMLSFGKNVDVDVDIRSQYLQREKGLQSMVKYIIDSASK